MCEYVFEGLLSVTIFYSVVGDQAKIRSFTSSFPVTSLVYVGSLSLIFV